MATSDNQALLLQVSADISRLEKAFDRAAGHVDKQSTFMERRAKQMAAKIEAEAGKINVGAALKNVFDSSRFQVLDSAIARVGIFGAALEPLGPAGLAAAAGIAAVGIAFAGAKAAAAYADDIADTAKRLHVTTDALQEYRFAIHEAGGEQEGADEALEAFNVTLGKAQQGLSKSQRGFLALGFSKDQIKGFSDADTALKAVAERIAQLSNVQQDAIIEQLGLNGLKPLLAGGVAEMQRLREEAHKVGVVMDSDLVARGGELNDEFETISRVIDVQLKSALVDLGPVLVGLLQQMADLARMAANVADAFRGIEEKRTSRLKDLAKDFEDRSRTPATFLYGGPKADRDRAARARAELAKREAETKPPPPPKPSRQLIDTSGKGGGSAPKDTTVARTEAVKAALAAAERDVLQALLGLTSDIEARGALQKQIIDAEQRGREARAAKQVNDIATDKGLTSAKKKELIAQLGVADAKEAEAAANRKKLIDQETADALAKQSLEATQARLDGEAEVLRLQASLTTSAGTQAAIALRLVDIAYQREKAELEAVIASKAVSEADREIARAKLRTLNATQPDRVEGAKREGSDPARRANDVIKGVKGQQNRAADHAAVLAEIDRQRQADVISERTAAQAKAQINAEYHAQRLDAASTFFGNLATLSGSSNKTLHAIGKAAAIAQATIDGVLAVQKALASAPPPWNFAIAAGVGVAAAVNVAKIAGLKDGGRVRGPGGPRDDKVPIWASDGEHVVNAPAANKHRALLEAINAGRDPTSAMAAPSFGLPPVAGSSSIVNRSGDASLTFAPQITNPTPSLDTLLRTEGRAMRTWMANEMRNNPKFWSRRP